MEMLAWYNLIFLISIGFSIVLAIGTTLGVGDSDHDFEAGVDVDVDPDFGGDKDSHPLDIPPEVSRSLMMRLLAALGFGRVPLMLLLMMYSLVFGITGFLALQVMQPMLMTPIAFGSASFAIAAVVSIMTAPRVARLINRVAPQQTSLAINRSDLIGHTGRIVVTATMTGGAAYVYDRHRSLHKINCRTAGETLGNGAEIIVSDYDEEDKIFLVEPATHVEKTQESKEN